jgi:HEAT repeat protein
MKPFDKRVLLGAAALLAVSLSALWWSGRSSEESAAVSPSSQARLQWRTGSAQQYDVRIDSAMRIDAPGASAAQSLRVAMTSVLDWVTLESGPESTWVGLRLSAVTLQVAGNSDPETNRALAVPFRARFSAAGMPEAFEFPAGVTAQNRTILENLVRTFQVTVQDGDDWTAREANASGGYEAVYRRTTPTRVEKTKRSFAPSPSVPMYTGANIASTETFHTDTQRDWLASMSVDETLSTQGQGGPGMQITNRATLELRTAAQVATTRDAWSFAAAAAPPAEAAQLPAAPKLSPEEASRQIVATVADLDATAEGRIALIHRLRDLLRVDGTQPGVLLRALQTEELTDRTRADLYLAFELAGTGEAQAALISVLGDPAWSTRDAMRAIVALGGVTRPTPETLGALWVAVQSSPTTDDGRQRASTATFALGSLGNTLNGANDPEYAVLRSQLLNGASSRGTGSQQANFVHAIGNTRDPSLARGIVPLLDDPNAEVRRAAALSLGMLDANQAAEQLVSHFDRESSSEVRGAIAEALVNWRAPTPEAMASMRNDVRTEIDENTRYNMARFLSTHLTAFPDNRAVLQGLLRTEQSRRIRQSVAEALATPR